MPGMDNKSLKKEGAQYIKAPEIYESSAQLRH